ncbi:O-antigen ligase family protein [Luteimonas sp. TWI165]|uniref:O-antigen ligase family protein n=1 Tax=Luteimonas sp. TWI165 TaxID=3136772 RepID=UPI00320A347E
MTNSTTTIEPVGTTPAPQAVGWRWAPHWVLAFVILWPAPGYAEGVMVLGALVAIVLLLRARFRGGSALLSAPAWALTSVLFCAYWLPQLISAIDSVDVGRALREALVDLRYLPFLWLVASAVADRRGRRITLGGLAIILAVWTIDGLVEVFFGTSPLFFGIDQLKHLISHRPMCTPEQVAMADRLGGVLGPCNLKLGIVLASLAPFALYAAGRRFGAAGWVVASAAIGVVLLFAGSRASWLTYALVLLFSGWRLLGWKRLLAVFVAGAAVSVVVALVSPQVRERVERTAMGLSADQSGVDTALSGRTRIWGAAWCMVREHPVNGVGARGFREAFPDCDPRPGQVAEWGDGPAYHAHQIVLDVAREPGVRGVRRGVADGGGAGRGGRSARRAGRDGARPAMLALAVTVFPLNTHLAFYSTFWGGFTLLLSALYAGSLLAREEPAPPGDNAVR